MANVDSLLKRKFISEKDSYHGWTDPAYQSNLRDEVLRSLGKIKNNTEIAEYPRADMWCYLGSCFIRAPDEGNIISLFHRRIYSLLTKVPSCIFFLSCLFPIVLLAFSPLCSPRCPLVFDHALPKYLSNDIERVQKRALSIILPDCSYSLCLSNHNLDTLQSRREEHCSKLFDSISNDHKLSHLFPTNHVNHYNPRRIRKYDLLSVRTKRFQRSFILSMCRLANSIV